MKILHLINNLDRGGIEMWLLSMLKAVPREHYVMDVCCRGVTVGSMAEDVRQLGVKVYHVPFGPLHIGFYIKLRRLIQSEGYNILHSHMGAYNGFAVWIAQQCGIPVITSFHNTELAPQTALTRRFGIRQLRRYYSERSTRYAVKTSHHITGCSASVIENLPIVIERAEKKSSVLYYGINLPPLPDAKERSDFRSSLGWPDDAYIITHVGRFFDQKNHAGLLKVFEKVHEQIPQARLLLVGDGMLRSKYEAYVSEQKLGDYVRFLGVRNDVPRLLVCSDIFLMPSLFEGFGLAALEANAAALPVIGTRTSGLLEAVDDGETGLLFDINDIEGMAAAVIRLFHNSSERKLLGTAGRKRVEDQFSVQASARQLMDLYDAYYCHA